MQNNTNSNDSLRVAFVTAALIACASVSTAHAQTQAQPARAATTTPQKAAPASKARDEATRQAALLNQALKQPMLAERATKSFLLINLKVLEARSRRHLDESLNDFSSTLKSLQRAGTTSEIKDNYALLEQLFDEFREIKAKPVNLENAKKLAEQNEELVWISQKGADLVQARSKSKRSEFVATAGEARTLTQRIAKLYLFRATGIRSDVIADDLKKAESEFRQALDRLKQSKENTPRLQSELALAETQWFFLRQAVDKLNSKPNAVAELETLSKACDNMLEVMDRITTLYADANA